MLEKNLLFLESQEGSISFFTKGILSGAAADGWSVSVVFLRESCGNPKEARQIKAEVAAFSKSFSCVAFLMDAPLEHPDLWDDGVWQQARKISLWFDDYFRSPLTLAHADVWEKWQSQYGVKVFMWDGHWRQCWRAMSGSSALPVHLAADPECFSSAVEPVFPELRGRAVMVGTIPALSSLEDEAKALPHALGKIVSEFADNLLSAPWPLRPYDGFENLLKTKDTKTLAVLNRWLSIPVNRAVLNHLLWRWGKRVARLRGLKVLAEAMPVAVLSGHRTETFARADEIGTFLGSRADFCFEETTEVPPDKWSGLFRSGAFQVQFTDPQSVEGGIPFRVFECAASGAVLLSDSRPELQAITGVGQGVFMVENDLGMADEATRLSGMSRDEIEQKCVAAKEWFLAGHTWKWRWRQIAAQAGF